MFRNVRDGSLKRRAEREHRTDRLINMLCTRENCQAPSSSAPIGGSCQVALRSGVLASRANKKRGLNLFR